MDWMSRWPFLREKSLVQLLRSLILVAHLWILPVAGAGCASSTPSPATPHTLPAQTAAATPAPTLTPSPTVTRTPRPTPGPNLNELMLTPQADAASANIQDAERGYLRITRLYPDQAEPLLALANLAARQGERELALTYLEKAVTAEPDSLDALTQLSIALEQIADYETLVDVYSLIIPLKPDTAAPLIARAVALTRLGESDAAISDLEAAGQIDEVSYAWINAVSAAYGSRQYQEALEMATAGLASYPDESSLLLSRGLAHLSLGDPQSALSDFDAILSTDPRNPRALRWRGRCLAELRRTDEAIVSLQSAANEGLAEGVSGIEEAFEAVTEAADLLALKDDLAAYEYLAQYVFEYGSRDPLLVGYARIDIRRGNTELAVSRLNPIVADGYIPAHYWRAVALAEQGERAAAQEDLLAFLSVVTAGPDAESAAALLDTLLEVQ